jgi:hypothetical protein
VPIVITFDIEGAEPLERNRIQSFFERFGWQNLGGSSYRYPKLGADPPVEDWLNHVVPALSLFRAYLRTSGRLLSKWTLDCQSSTGFSASDDNFGQPALASSDVKFYPSSKKSFGLKKLRKWLDGVDYPYP